jgi:transposase
MGLQRHRMRSRRVPTVPPLAITDQERAELQRRVRAHTTPQRAAKRARIVLLAADGVPNRQIARIVGMNQHTVAQWRRRFQAERLAGLQDRKRPGRPLVYDHDQRLRIVAPCETCVGSSGMELRPVEECAIPWKTPGQRPSAGRIDDHGSSRSGGDFPAAYGRRLLPVCCSCDGCLPRRRRCLCAKRVVGGMSSSPDRHGREAASPMPAGWLLVCPGGSALRESTRCSCLGSL